MPDCDFYAVDEEFTPILEFLFAQPGWVLVELGSRHDEPLRRFRSTAELLALDLRNWPSRASDISGMSRLSRRDLRALRRAPPKARLSTGASAPEGA